MALELRKPQICSMILERNLIDLGLINLSRVYLEGGNELPSCKVKSYRLKVTSYRLHVTCCKSREGGDEYDTRH